MANALEVSGLSLPEFEGRMAVRLPQSVKWREFLAGRRDPDQVKVDAVELEFPGTARCWHSSFWQIQRGSWFDDEALKVAIQSVNGPIGEQLRSEVLLLCVVEGRPSSALSDRLSTSISFETIETLSLLANLAHNQNNLSLANWVANFYLKVLPRLKQIASIRVKADGFFPHIGTVFAADRILYRQAVGDRSALTGAAPEAALMVEAHTQDAPTLSRRIAGSWATAWLCIERYWRLPPRRKYAGLLGLLLLALLDSPAAESRMNFAVIFVVSMVLLAVAVDRRVADYRPPFPS